MGFEPEIPPIQVHLCVKDGKAAIAFYEAAFGAVETFEQMAEDGERVLHANLSMFGSEVMLQDEFPEISKDVLGPTSRGGASATVNINLAKPDEVDAAVARAVAAGAQVVLPVDDQFWGARYGKIRDPFGHVWSFNAPLEQGG
ncbi:MULTISPECIES: VOC family protein [Nitratireductor]|uniref:VOC family protein n=1 Tax=Nitratireductor TaxID=245876 RepID=UPI000D0CBE38|nr:MULTISPECIES: VOC family protein [Nitratireductor]PSM19117.1 VOC family protein [Nitratireductor sp. StC3]